MQDVNFQGMTFETYLTREQIAQQVKRVAEQIVADATSDNPIFICVLSGAFMFAADLFRECRLANAEICFIRFKSYEGITSTGHVEEIMGLHENITGRDVIIIEDIVDTGVTAYQLRQKLQKLNPKSIRMATLLFKPESLKIGEPPEYFGFEIPSKFIIGYGLDIDGCARNLSEIYVLKKN